MAPPVGARGADSFKRLLDSLPSRAQFRQRPVENPARRARPDPRLGPPVMAGARWGTRGADRGREPSAPSAPQAPGEAESLLGLGLGRAADRLANRAGRSQAKTPAKNPCRNKLANVPRLSCGANPPQRINQ